MCQAPNDANICPNDTDLAGVYANNTITDCDLTISANPQAQCIKCADLAPILGTGQSTQRDAANALIGNSTNNVFTICDDEDPTAQFNATMNQVLGNQAPTVNSGFARCLDNAPDSMAAAHITSLQESSMTTSVQAEREIPTINTQLENPALNTLLENPNVKSLLENPDLNALLQNPDENALLQNPDVKALLENPEVNALLQDPNVNAHLQNPSISALTGLFP